MRGMQEHLQETPTTRFEKPNHRRGTGNRIRHLLNLVRPRPGHHHPSYQPSKSMGMVPCTGQKNLPQSNRRKVSRPEFRLATTPKNRHVVHHTQDRIPHGATIRTTQPGRGHDPDQPIPHLHHVTHWRGPDQGTRGKSDQPGHRFGRVKELTKSAKSSASFKAIFISLFQDYFSIQIIHQSFSGLHFSYVSFLEKRPGFKFTRYHGTDD